MSLMRRLTRYYLYYTAGFVAFVVMVGLLEQTYGAGVWVGYVFMFVTIAIYAIIGLVARTSDPVEYYVAGRRVPPVFNGMACAADWMSAASFMGLAGSLYVSGFDGLAYVMGWTGGYCLVAFLLAPYLRKLGRYTLPDFLGTRYDSNIVRGVGVFSTILCSFVYLVAQIQGVGLIAARFIGVDFSIGIFFGLAGILVCSFLGGMRAVTWTQVAQYIIMIVAFLVTTALVGHQTGTGWLPQLSYGKVLARVEQIEHTLDAQAPEQAVRDHYRQLAMQMQQRLDGLPHSYAQGKTELRQQLRALRQRNAALREVKAVEDKLQAYPRSVHEARDLWTARRNDYQARSQVPQSMTVPFAATDAAARAAKRLNFLLLMLCLMVGTASLPHILTRYNTTTGVAAARSSVGWTLFFVVLLYISAPVLAVLLKYDVLTHLVGQRYDNLPAWVSQWQKVMPAQLEISDVYRDGVVQWGEIWMHPDMLVLAAPEIAGLPYVISGLIAAGALAAVLSTADGLLLTIANALSHDVYFHMLDRQASAQKRVTASKLLVLCVALFAAYVTSLQLGNILFLVGAAFSLAASSLFPVLVLGVFWRRVTRAGAIAGMLAGLGVCVYYIVATYPFFTRLTGFTGVRWFGVDPISAGTFGIPAGFAAAILVSLLSPRPDQRTRQLVNYLREP
ncbi:MAG: cation acetate symporter [Burkholderiales bacterium]|nr:cation acetate symporter [Burkholderiales bacterium]MDE2290394.1 cation acetate symporter [Burkholderiales bacterium]